MMATKIIKTSGSATEMPIIVPLGILVGVGGCDGSCEGSRLPAFDGILLVCDGGGILIVCVCDGGGMLVVCVCDGVVHNKLLSDDCQHT